MANGRQASVKRLKMAERAQQQLELHFPGTSPTILWHRKTNDGFTTVPRTMPIAMQAIDAQTKGSPAGHTLFGLWARAPDFPFVSIENPTTFAAEAGFTGERAVDTWRKRMKALRDLGFIACKKGPSGDFHYVMLINPNVTVESLYQKGKIQEGLYARFIDRVIEIGAFGEIEAYREYLAALDAQNKAQAANSENGSERLEERVGPSAEPAK
ncbi:hypothetical protein Brsp06_04629 [Brucella sp. NBRC 13694]|jgi:hypothetical protein|uniref:hypothetical protein n=1 Tax=Brucella/Ochrobactrum group TaxID=2826938 RepID=UPI000F65BF53|nr:MULTISPECIES: hypothetical protein [Brucella/Ochrobactrum group]MCR5943663.1 hypothetical protein [Ochrobactrum sp. XJ1]RRY15815.1 hypothetical protein EGJ57_23710 [Brucella anthropi]TMU86180.1 hypothetical protein FGI60_25540 [Brucella haematophila]